MKDFMFAYLYNDKNEMINDIEFEVPKKLLKFDDIKDLIVHDVIIKDMQNLINDIVNNIFYKRYRRDILEGVIERIYLAFIDNEGDFFCTFIIDDVSEIYKDNDKKKKNPYLIYRVQSVNMRRRVC